MNAQPAPSASTTAAPRSAAIDAVRSFGIVAVVAGHTWQEAWVSGWIFSWHVPLFFVISGYLWKPHRSAGEELRRRSRTLLLPYVAWLTLVCGIWFTARLIDGQDYSNEPFRDIILGGWYIARPWSAFWFISALFVATVVMRYLDNISTLLPWFIGALALGWCWLAPESARSVPMAVVQGLAAMLFLKVGELLRRHRQKLHAPIPFALVLVAAPMTLFVLGVLPSLNMKAAVLGAPVISAAGAAAVACGLIVLADATEHRWPSWARQVALMTARLGMPIILGHALCLALFDLYEVPQSWATFLVALLAPALLGWLLGRTRLRSIFL